MQLQNKRRRTVRRLVRKRWVLGAVTVCTLINLVLLWLGVEFRLYFSAAAPFYANFFAWTVEANAFVCLLAGILGVAGCLLYPACLLFSTGIDLGLSFYAADTAVLLTVALFFLENPICCLPELFMHALVLLLLAPPLSL